MILICIEDKRSCGDTKRQVIAVGERTASLIAYFLLLPNPNPKP